MELQSLFAKDFRFYSSFVNGLEQDELLSKACKARENNIIVSRLKEYFIAYVLKGTVAFDIGCDIVNSRIFPGKKIEVKSTDKSIIPTRKTKYKHLCKDIIITNKFQANNTIDVKSDIFVFNIEGDKQTIFCRSKDIEPYIRGYQSKLFFNTKYLDQIDHSVVEWDEDKPLSRTQILNLLKYCASPMPQIEYGSFNEYLDFCLTHDFNHFNLAKSVCHTITSQN
jgi:hypothetical protein